jgi:hypothetical protein
VFYAKNNLSVIAHLPTRSEFYIRVMSAEKIAGGAEPTAKRVMDAFREVAGATEPNTKNTEARISQNVQLNHLETAHSRKEEFVYLKSEFTGHRFDTDRYGKKDPVNITAYVTCLTCAAPVRDKSLYFVAFAMIPVPIADGERDRLLRVLQTFLESVILYQE